MFARIATILALSTIPPVAFGQGVIRDDFEGPQTVLRPAGGDAGHEVKLHERTGQGAHSGRWCEQVRITGNDGTAVYYSYPIAKGRVIHEWAARLWVRADRPGLQIVARVVLPRSKHPASGEALTTLIRGSAYQQVGGWQMLQIDKLPRALEGHVRVLRTQFGPQVDAREAYVDLVLVNVYGGPGTTNVWLDDFEATGLVAPASAMAVTQTRGDGDPVYASAQDGGPAPTSMPRVQWRGRLQVGGEPFLPRIIEHQGEPLARLKALGFNCVRVARVPPRELLAEAAQIGMWLIAPPPTGAQIATGGDATGGAVIDASFDPVLAWDLGSGLSERDLEPTRQWAELVRSADPRDRPIVCHAEGELTQYTRPPFKVLLARQETLGTSLELAQYDEWIGERTQLARAAATLWVTIPTDPSPALVEQIRLVAGMPLAAPVWQEAQIRAMVRTALGARARGLYFTSHSRLDAADPATRLRALTLELVNLELQLIERWPAAGNVVAGADTTERNTRGGVIQTDRTRLLMPIYAPPGGQFVLGTQRVDALGFVVAGVPEGDNAYQLSLTRLRPLRSERVTGGTRVILGEFNRDSLVVFTQDFHAIDILKKTLAQNAERAAQVVRDLAAARLAYHDTIVARLVQVGRALPTTVTARTQAETNLRECDALLRTDMAKAYDRARHALEIMRQIERVYWEQATAAPNVPLVDPLTACFATLAEHDRFRNEVASAQYSDNRLAEGGCENLAAMHQAGWKHYSHPQEGIQTSVDFAPAAAHGGAAGLLLRAESADPKVIPAAVETPPVWVTSAPVSVEAGDLVRIQAWVRIGAPITGSVDGLVVIDSLSGPELALRVLKTGGWKQITMYRAAARQGPMSVTFALAGLGEAAIDDVTIEIVRHRGPLGGQAQR